MVKGLQHFMEVHVCCYKDYLDTPVHFVGSLSVLLEDELRIAAENLGIEIRSVTAKPIQNLVDYHLKYILKNEMA